MQGKTLMEVLDEDRPQAPVVKLPANSHAAMAARSLARQVFLEVSGYTIAPDGEDKVLKVNRNWISGGGDKGQWLLFRGKDEPLKCQHVIFLDETTTEIEVIQTSEMKEEAYGCGGGTRMVEKKKEVRSAYLISTGRAAYKLA